MSINLPIDKQFFEKLHTKAQNWPWLTIVFVTAFSLSYFAIIVSLKFDWIVAYGDSESHLNIAKRVVDGLTPGMAQLGGIWLPLPHLLMIPFVYFDLLWRTGLAGSIISGISFIISSIFIYKIAYVVTKNSIASFIAFLTFALNPNILYMQSTPLTELPLIVFFVLSSYFFIKYLYRESDYISLILAGLFGFCATLSRYDGWFLVTIEGLIIIIRAIVQRYPLSKIQGRVILFSALAFFGILLWLLWGTLILGDPFYFTHSQFSANAQQQGWLARGQLPAYHNIFLAFLYYFITSMSDIGIILFVLAIAGFVGFLLQKHYKYRYFIALVMLIPFIFYFISLYIGQAVIFIPSLTPVGFDWRLFNTRYGVMMVPFASLFVGYLFYMSKTNAKVLIICLFIMQFMLYGIGYSHVLTWSDGISGLSQAKRPDAEHWLKLHYDHGLVLLDDYSRLTSIIRSGIPMENVIYIGTKPYWQESIQQPEKYATWIIIQRNDTLWREIYSIKSQRDRLYSYFQKEYTSPDIIIFKRIQK